MLHSVVLELHWVANFQKQPEHCQSIFATWNFLEHLLSKKLNDDSCVEGRTGMGGELYSLSSAAKLVRHVFHAYASAGVISENGLGIPA